MRSRHSGTVVETTSGQVRSGQVRSGRGGAKRVSPVDPSPLTALNPFPGERNEQHEVNVNAQVWHGGGMQMQEGLTEGLLQPKAAGGCQTQMRHAIECGDAEQQLP